MLLGDICAEDNPNFFMVSHFSGSKAILYAESAVLPLKSTNKYQRRTPLEGDPQAELGTVSQTDIKHLNVGIIFTIPAKCLI